MGFLESLFGEAVRKEGIMQSRINTERFLLKIALKKRILVTGLTGFEGYKIFNTSDYFDLYGITIIDDQNRYNVSESDQKVFNTILASRPNICVGKIDEPRELNNLFDEIFFIVPSFAHHHVLIHELKDGWIFPNLSPILREIYSQWTFHDMNEYMEVVQEEFLDYTCGVRRPAKLVHTSLY